MSSSREIILEILIFSFVSSIFLGCVGCASVLLKKCYDKYVIQQHLPNDPELSTDPFQNLESRYAKATVSVIHDRNQYRDVDFVEVRVSGYEQGELVETNIIAEEVTIQNP